MGSKFEVVWQTSLITHTFFFFGFLFSVSNNKTIVFLNDTFSCFLLVLLFDNNYFKIIYIYIYNH